MGGLEWTDYLEGTGAARRQNGLFRLTGLYGSEGNVAPCAPLAPGLNGDRRHLNRVATILPTNHREAMRFASNAPLFVLVLLTLLSGCDAVVPHAPTSDPTAAPHVLRANSTSGLSMEVGEYPGGRTNTVNLFSRIDNVPAGVVVIDYDWQMEAEDEASHTGDAPYRVDGPQNEFSYVDNWPVGVSGFVVTVGATLSDGSTVYGQHIVAGSGSTFPCSQVYGPDCR